MKIEYLIGISGATLVVYCIDEKCYQYEIVFWDRTIYQPQEMYESANKARDVGLKNIKIVIGY
jgi:hypothetical protein